MLPQVFGYYIHPLPPREDLASQGFGFLHVEAPPPLTM